MNFYVWREIVLKSALVACEQEYQDTGHRVEASVEFEEPDYLPGVVMAHITYSCPECGFVNEMTFTRPMDLDGLIDP